MSLVLKVYERPKGDLPEIEYKNNDAEAARLSWDNHLKIYNSIIVDLFHVSQENLILRIHGSAFFSNKFIP